MSRLAIAKLILGCVVIVGLSACGNLRSGASQQRSTAAQEVASSLEVEDNRSSFFDLFRNTDDPNTTLEVNKYLWNASLDVLNFMPIQAADPFTGTIVMGPGRPRGGGAAYRATVYITDPALDARALRVSLRTAGGNAVSKETQRAIEDAILTRARQLRIQDTKL